MVMLRRVFLVIGGMMAVLFGASCSSKLDEELVKASAQGNVERVQELLAEGADVDAIAVKEWTPLTAAAEHGHLDAVKVLSLAGARIDRPAPGGVTALFLTVVNGDTEIVEYLLLNGADPNIGGGKKEYMRAVVQKEEYVEIAALLRQHGFLLDFEFREK